MRPSQAVKNVNGIAAASLMVKFLGLSAIKRTSANTYSANVPAKPRTPPTKP